MRNRFAAWALILAWQFVAAVAADEPSRRGDFAGAVATTYPDWFKQSFLDLQEDIDDAAAESRQLLILFHQDNCPYCNMLVERNLSQRDIERRLRRHFDVVALNMWGDREVMTIDGQSMTEKALAAALKVQFTPTMLFFDGNGTTALRLNGYIPPSQFMQALDYLVDGDAGGASFHDYLAARASPPAGDDLRRDPLLVRAPGDLSRLEPPIAVVFEQIDCPNCARLHDGPLADAETRQLLGAFAAVQLDMWSDTQLVTPAGEETTARVWARQLDIVYAPTIVLFDDARREVIRSEALFKVFHTQSMFDYVLSGAYRDQPSFQRYLSQRADHIRDQGRDVDISR